MDTFKNLNEKLTFILENTDANTLKKILNGFNEVSNTHKITRLSTESSQREAQEQIVNFLLTLSSIRMYPKKFQYSADGIIFLIYMGHIYTGLGMFEKSVAFYKEALIQHRLITNSHLLIAELFQKIGRFYEIETEYDEALIYYEEALSIRKRLSYVKNNLLVAESYNTLAVVYCSMEEYAVAKRYIDKAVRIREKILSPNHQLLLNSYYNQKFLTKACEPKIDYLSFGLKFLQEGLGIFFRGMINKKKF